jgi:hypothetical protein
MNKSLGKRRGQRATSDRYWVWEEKRKKDLKDFLLINPHSNVSLTFQKQNIEIN